jgi:hypothetical protein
MWLPAGRSRFGTLKTLRSLRSKHSRVAHPGLWPARKPVQFLLQAAAIATLVAGLNGALSMSMQGMITASLRAGAASALFMPASPSF